jgi:hypothetical protein
MLAHGYDPFLDSPIERGRSTVREGRKEQRNPRKLQVLLSSVKEPLMTEPGSTENVSPHGLRVLAEWPWLRHTRLIVQSSEGGLWGRAKVVYCQTLPANTFALGLELVARTGGWITGYRR